MSDTATPSSADPSCQPAGPLVSIVIAFLAPMFLWVGDIALARAAALETLNAYRVSSHRSLITAAKIIAFELAALSSLSQSMAEDISVPLALRLRGNANSLDRAAERNRQALEHEQRAAAMAAETAHFTEEAAAAVAQAQKAVRDAKARARAMPAPTIPAPASAPIAASVPTPPDRALATRSAPTPRDSASAVRSTPAPQVPTPAAQPAPAPQVDAPVTGQQWQTAWADAMAEVAAEFTAGLPSLPSAERAAEMIRIQSLTEAARTLASGPQVTFADIPGLATGQAGVQG
jgi:hypothetical protein